MCKHGAFLGGICNILEHSIVILADGYSAATQKMVTALWSHAHVYVYSVFGRCFRLIYGNPETHVFSTM